MSVMTRFRILPDDSSILLAGKSSVHRLHGKAGSLTGTIDVEIGSDGKPDLNRPYSAELSLPATAITWGGGIYDRETRRRLDVGAHPFITACVVEAFVVEGNAGLRVRVRLTVRGQTRVIDGQARLHVESGRLVVEGERVIDIREFGMEPPRLVMLKVDPQVTVQVRVVAEAET
jgi:polyisoprenoid-binding protein YceI